MFEGPCETPRSFPSDVSVCGSCSCVVVADHVSIVSPNILEVLDEAMCIVPLIHLINGRSRKHLLQVD